MKRKDKFAALSNYIEAQNYIEIQVQGEKVDCIPLRISRDFLLVLNYWDFTPDGFAIFRIEDIEKISETNTCIYFETIVKAEGVQEVIAECPEIELESFTSIFRSLCHARILTEVSFGKGQAMMVGRVLTAEKEHVVMHCFSPTGEWEKRDWTELYTEIMGIKILSRYSKMFQKYLPRENYG